MNRIPKLSKKMKVKVTVFFDLGFIVQNTVGRELQLRVQEMNDEYLTLDRESRIHEKLGALIDVFEFVDAPCRVSQLTEEELIERNKERCIRIEASRQKFRE